MKIFASIFFLILMVSCTRRNIANESNWSGNSQYLKEYKAVSLRTPIQNIPYIVTYVGENPNYKDENMKQKMMGYARYSYNFYEKDVNQMKGIMSTVSQYLKENAIEQNKDVKYIYSKEEGEYIIDPESVTHSVEISDLQERYNVNSRMGYKTSIPVKNAYEIMKMQYSGHVPNEKYFNSLLVNSPPEIKTYEFVGSNYKKTKKEDIYMSAGDRVVNFVNKAYEKMQSKNK